MGGRVLFLARFRLVGPVVEPAGHLLDMLEQGAAECGIQLLNAAAHRHQRHAARDGVVDQLERQRVALGITRRGRTCFVAAIVMRFDVGEAAGQEDAVEAIKQVVQVDQGVERVEIGAAAERGDHHRHGPGAVRDGVDVLLADRVERVDVDLLDATGDADQRQGKVLVHGGNG